MELYVWSKAQRLIMSEAVEEIPDDFEVLLRWLHGYSTTFGDEQGLGRLLGDAVEAVVAADKDTYNSRKAKVKETVYMAVFGL